MCIVSGSEPEAADIATIRTLIVEVKPVNISPTDKGLKVAGKVIIKMSDHGIKAPAPKIALGLITTGDEVSLSFEWFTQKR